jgi:tetratricopeptide (TPR) repeat protein
MTELEILFYSSLLSLVIAIFADWLVKRIERLSENKAYSKKIDYIIVLCFLISLISFVLLLGNSQDDSEPISSVGFDFESRCTKAIWNNKGFALFKLGKLEEALKAYDKAIGIDPQYTYAWNNKGYAFKSLGRIAEADAAFTKARDFAI